MREREGDDANVAVWTPSSVSEMFREDHPDGCEPKAFTTSLCYLPSQDPATETGASTCYQ